MTSGTTTYTYDELDRLTLACYTVACSGPGDDFRRYTYDPTGNRLTEVRDTGTTTSAYNAADELLSTSGPGGTVSYTHDLDGRLTAAGSRSFSWALPARLTTTASGNTTSSYTYDGDGLRLKASSGPQAAKTTLFEWDVVAAVPLLVRERDGNDGFLRRYRYGLGLLSLDSGANIFYVHPDGLGSTANITSASGATRWTYTYHPFGELRSETKNGPAPANLMKFAGEYQDPTGLYYLRARQYDPSTGRFLSTDPVSPSLADPYVGSYVYVGNNPVRWTDPSGQCWWLVPQGAAVGGAGGAAAGGVGALPGAAGGALVGFVACVATVAAATVTAAVVANSIRDQRVGDVIPPITNAPFVTQPFDPRVPLPGPPGKEPFNPHGPGGKKVLAALAAIFTAVSTLVNPAGTKEPFADPRVARRTGIK